MKIKTTVSAAAAALTTAAVMTACGSSAGPDLTYAPAAYGVPGHCYYVDDPAEAIALQNAGLCPRSWAPTLMPVAWEEEYYDYYSSPAYYGTYVPVRIRTVYVQRETTFGHTYHTSIVARSKTATYRSSAGTVVKGSTLTGKTRFGSGKSVGASGQKYGGGSLRSGSSTSRSGSGGYSSSRSGYSGSSRSGSLRSGSYSGSRSRSHH